MAQHLSRDATPHTDASMIDARRTKNSTQHRISHKPMTDAWPRCDPWSSFSRPIHIPQWSTSSVVIPWQMLDQNSTHTRLFLDPHAQFLDQTLVTGFRDWWDAKTRPTHVPTLVKSPSVRGILNPWLMPAFPQPRYIPRSSVTWPNSRENLDLALDSESSLSRSTVEKKLDSHSTQDRAVHGPIVESVMTHDRQPPDSWLKNLGPRPNNWDFLDPPPSDPETHPMFPTYILDPRSGFPTMAPSKGKCFFFLLFIKN